MLKTDILKCHCFQPKAKRYCKVLYRIFNHRFRQALQQEVYYRFFTKPLLFFHRYGSPFSIELPSDRSSRFLKPFLVTGKICIMKKNEKCIHWTEFKYFSHKWFLILQSDVSGLTLTDGNMRATGSD